MNNELFNEALERIELLNDELNKVKRALIAASEGKPFNEAFNDEVFLEDSSPRREASSKLSRMIQHLFKAKYSTIDRLKDDWKDESDEIYRSAVIDITGWYSDKDINNTVINHLRNTLQSIYNTGIKMYNNSAKKYPDLIPGQKMIPKECPWTLDELMEDLIDDLLDKLPDKK